MLEEEKRAELACSDFSELHLLIWSVGLERWLQRGLWHRDVLCTFYVLL
jgi:hypothetical protein